MSVKSVNQSVNQSNLSSVPSNEGVIPHSIRECIRSINAFRSDAMPLSDRQMYVFCTGSQPPQSAAPQVRPRNENTPSSSFTFTRPGLMNNASNDQEFPIPTHGNDSDYDEDPEFVILEDIATDVAPAANQAAPTLNLDADAASAANQASRVATQTLHLHQVSPAFRPTPSVSHNVQQRPQLHPTESDSDFRIDSNTPPAAGNNLGLPRLGGAGSAPSGSPLEFDNSSSETR